MIGFSYLERGVTGLAHAHRAGGMAGHLGAAVAAGYFFGEDLPELSEPVFRGVEGELDRIIGGEEAIWFNPRQAGVTPQELFDPLPVQRPTPEAIGTIADALSSTITETRQSGHNVIFASIALRALHDHPDFATPATIDGIVRLTATFRGQHAGRGYYGRDAGWKTGREVRLAADPSFAPYESIDDLVRVTLSELIATGSIKKQGFGGLWHVINHAAGIVELDRYGYRDLARRALPAHHHHVRLWRSLPDVAEELGAVEASQLDPREPEYWQGMLERDEARLTHRIKTLYGYWTLRRLVDDAALGRQADDALRYLMA